MLTMYIYPFWLLKSMQICSATKLPYRIRIWNSFNVLKNNESCAKIQVCEIRYAWQVRKGKKEMLGMSNYVHTTKIKDDMIGYKERRETWKEVLYHIAHNVVLFLMPWMQHKVRLLYFSEISLPNKYQKNLQSLQY